MLWNRVGFVYCFDIEVVYYLTLVFFNGEEIYCIYSMNVVFMGYGLFYVVFMRFGGKDWYI